MSYTSHTPVFLENNKIVILFEKYKLDIILNVCLSYLSRFRLCSGYKLFTQVVTINYKLLVLVIGRWKNMENASDLFANKSLIHLNSCNNLPMFYSIMILGHLPQPIEII